MLYLSIGRLDGGGIEAAHDQSTVAVKGNGLAGGFHYYLLDLDLTPPDTCVNGEFDYPTRHFRPQSSHSEREWYKRQSPPPTGPTA